MNDARILIVEDDPDLRLGYKVLLQAQGYETFFAGDVSAALRQVSAHLPDLVILDLGLPGPDGFSVLEESIEQNSADTVCGLYVFLAPVIVVSARDPHINRDRALKAGAKAYLQKPCNDGELLVIIRNALNDNDDERNRGDALDAR